MSSSTNIGGGGNFIDEFEEAFQSCLLALTKLENSTKEETEFEAQKTMNRFIDVARQMEAFFLQRRFLASTLKPDQLIKDENQDLRIEIQRKEALLNKHYSRLEEWKACLSDIQQNPTMLNRPVGALGGIPGGMMPAILTSDPIAGGLSGVSVSSMNLGVANTSMATHGSGGLIGQPQRSGMMPNLPGSLVGQLPQMIQGNVQQQQQQHLQNQKLLQAQQMQQLRMMGKLSK